MKDRERREELDEDVALVVTRSSTHPFEYAVVLIVRRDGTWHAVRSFDNAHDVHEHHDHSYIGSEKQEPVVSHGQPKDALGTTLLMLKEHWADIVAEWDSTR